MRTPLRALAALLFAASFAASASGLTIDNFEEGDFVVADTSAPGTPTFGEQSGLLTSNVVGGVRLVRALAAGGVTGTATLVTTGGDDGALLSSAGPPAGLTDFAFIYDGVANSSPIGGASGAGEGSAGTLNVDISAFPSIDVDVSAPSAIVGGIRVTLWDSTSSRSSGIQPLVIGTNSLLLDGTILQLDLTNIKAILIAITDINPGETPTIQGITSIPEPGTALLMAVGLAGLAIRRRHSR